MFFIGVFGIQDKDRYIGAYNNIVCPVCGKLARYEIHKTYRYLHIFFIPTFRWNTRYIVKASCCGSIYELDPLRRQGIRKIPGLKSGRKTCGVLTIMYLSDTARTAGSMCRRIQLLPYCGGKGNEIGRHG